MQELKSADRKVLKGLANPLKPIVMIGRNGLNESVLQSIDEALQDHELIKVRFQEYKESKKELCQEIAEKEQCHHVGLIGHVGIFYRPAKDPEKRKIHLGKEGA